MESARQNFRVAGALQRRSWTADRGLAEPGVDSEAARRAAGPERWKSLRCAVYSRGPMRREGLQMGFAAVNAQEIKRGVQQLHGA